MKQRMVGRLVGLALAFAFARTADARTIEMEVTGMVCGNCAAAVKEELAQFDGETSRVFVDVEHGVVALELADGKDVDDGALRRAVGEAGFAVKSIGRSDASIDAIERRLAGDGG